MKELGAVDPEFDKYLLDPEESRLPFFGIFSGKEDIPRDVERFLSTRESPVSPDEVNEIVNELVPAVEFFTDEMENVHTEE